MRPMRPLKHRRDERGVTLVELLIVIAALALVVALLMPALAGARSQAYRLVCRSNLRQLVLANIGYATEDEGFFVPAARDIPVLVVANKVDLKRSNIKKIKAVEF